MLGAYLRDFEALLAAHGVDGLPYGHFGDGCVHVRMDFPFGARLPTCRGSVPSWSESAALVVAHGGSLSGEHGDGRARSELLPAMYSPEVIALFGRGQGPLRPGRRAQPRGARATRRPLDADLRRPLAAALRRRKGFAFSHDHGDLTTPCTAASGWASAVRTPSAAGGFMCPSYLATRDEKDSTRGRARVLQEMANGALVTQGWRAPEVREALDLCLSCKACSSDCPAGVDMAAYKAEVLHRAYRYRVAADEPLRARLAAALGAPGRPAAAGRAGQPALGFRPLGRAVLRLGGMDTHRQIPRFAATSFHRAWTQGEAAERATGERSARDLEPSDGRPVVLWADSFSDGFDPDVPQAMVDVLRAAGYRVIVPAQDACCGLTWISTGQLDGARRRLAHLLEVLRPVRGQRRADRRGRAVLHRGAALGPARAAAGRPARGRRRGRDPHARRAAARAPDWTPPRLDGVRVIAQPHCHQHSVMGYGADLEVLASTGAEVTTLAGCCGLAGNFGMETRALRDLGGGG